MSKDRKNIVWAGVGINLRSGDNGFGDLVGLAKKINPSINEESFVPHLNLYDVDFPIENLERFESEVQELAKTSSLLEVKTIKVESFSYGMIYLGCNLSDELKKLHENVVNRLNPLRDGIATEDYWQPWRTYNIDQVENRNKFGNPHVMNSFFPHISLGFGKDKAKLRDICDELNKRNNIKRISCDRLDLVVKTDNRETIANKRFYFNEKI